MRTHTQPPHGVRCSCIQSASTYTCAETAGSIALAARDSLPQRGTGHHEMVKQPASARSPPQLVTLAGASRRVSPPAFLAPVDWARSCDGTPPRAGSRGSNPCSGSTRGTAAAKRRSEGPPPRPPSPTASVSRAHKRAHAPCNPDKGRQRRCGATALRAQLGEGISLTPTRRGNHRDHTISEATQARNKCERVRQRGCGSASRGGRCLHTRRRAPAIASSRWSCRPRSRTPLRKRTRPVKYMQRRGRRGTQFRTGTRRHFRHDHLLEVPWYERLQGPTASHAMRIEGGVGQAGRPAHAACRRARCSKAGRTCPTPSHSAVARNTVGIFRPLPNASIRSTLRRSAGESEPTTWWTHGCTTPRRGTNT
jgi:hypothetical protein